MEIYMPSKEHTHTVIFLHGRDSTAKEFASEFFESQASDGRTFTQIFPNVKWLFPTAGMLESARFGSQLSQWFDMHSTENPHEREGEQDLSASILRIQRLVAQETAAVRLDRIMLGGISQGCAVAIHALLTMHTRLGGFIGLCGWLPQASGISAWKTAASMETPVLLAHAEDDEVINIHFGIQLRDTLSAFGMKVKWANYKDGGHWLNEPQGVNDIVSFLKQIVLLRKQIAATESQLASLKQQLSQAESRVGSTAHQEGISAECIGKTLTVVADKFNGDAGLAHVPHEIAQSTQQDTDVSEKELVLPVQMNSRWPLSGDEYRRYGRQMIMSEIGLHGQLRLKNARVLVVGCGGLGCPAAAYLAGAGVGTLGLVDGDVVEVSNLHRQVAHATGRVGMSKVESAYEYLKELNPLVKYERHPSHLSPSSALPIFSNYDIALDCTDHPTSRYLISDACILTGKPLVSASALKTEGQLIVLNNPPRTPGDSSGGPCYRCIFPKPPPAESVLSCGEGGILGPVVGVMGVLQALEAIKLLVAMPATQQSKRNDKTFNNTNHNQPQDSPKANMLIFSAHSQPQFRSVRMRSRHVSCAACSSNATITPAQLHDGSLDYAVFCGLTNPIDILDPNARINAGDFARMHRDESHILIDTRDETQYAMCALRDSINVPWTGNSSTWVERAAEKGALPLDRPGTELYVVCRNGNDSQLAVKAIRDLLSNLPDREGPQPGQSNLGDETGPVGTRVSVRDIKGGFRAWREEVDADWPDY